MNETTTLPSSGLLGDQGYEDEAADLIARDMETYLEAHPQALAMLLLVGRTHHPAIQRVIARMSAAAAARRPGPAAA